MKQFAYTDLPMSALKDHFAEIMSSGYSVSLFTEWQNKNIHQVWVKSVVDTGPDTTLEIYGAKKVVDRDLHPINGMPIDDVTIQRGVPGPWYEILSQYKVDAGMPGVGIELQVSLTL
jgi:alditol oxidase